MCVYHFIELNLLKRCELPKQYESALVMVAGVGGSNTISSDGWRHGKTPRRPKPDNYVLLVLSCQPILLIYYLPR